MKMDYEEIENRFYAKKYNSKDLLLSNIDQLINEKVFEKTADFMDSNYFKSEDSADFEGNLQINSKQYRLSAAVLKEIFTTLKFLVEEAKGIDYFDLNIVESNVDARYSISEKIEYLEDKRKELYLALQNEPEYYLYIGKRSVNGFDTWEELICDVVLYEDLLIKKFLVEDIQITDIPESIFSIWHNFYKSNELITICEQKISELLLVNTVDSIAKDESSKTKKSSQKNIDLSFQLALFEEIMKLENWDDISGNKKGLILTNMLGKDKDNIKNYYNESVKSLHDKSSKFYDETGKYRTDKSKASKLLKEILG